MSRLERVLVIGVCFFASAFLQGVITHAATYHVAPTGDDANSCAHAKSSSTPKKTIQAGVSCLAGGDTLIIKAGTYTGSHIIYNPPAGTENAYTVIKGDPSGPRPVLTPTSGQRGFYCDNGALCRYIEMRYLEVNGAYNYMKLSGTDIKGYPHHIRVIDNVFHHSSSVGVLILSSKAGVDGGDHVFRGNEFYQTGATGAPGYPPGYNSIYNTGNRTIVEHNVFHNNTHGVAIWAQNHIINNVIVRNNVFYDMGRPLTDTWQAGANSYSAIHVSVGGNGTQIYNNVIYRSGDNTKFLGIVVKPYGTGRTTDVVKIYNNTIYNLLHAGAEAILVIPTAPGSYLIKNNIAYLAGLGIVGGTQSNNLTDDPSFRDPARAIFTLQSGSPAIDKGMDAAIVPTDFAGVPRPQGAGYDIGAYEAGDGSDPRAPQNLSAR